jgi:hypothetical protein
MATWRLQRHVVEKTVRERGMFGAVCGVTAGATSGLDRAAVVGAWLLVGLLALVVILLLAAAAFGFAAAFFGPSAKTPSGGKR